MSSSSRARLLGLAALALVTAVAARASAQQMAQGFSAERFYPSAPGAGWLVMDDLDMQGYLGGVMGLTLGYAHDPLQVASGGQQLNVISDAAFADFGVAITHQRWRFYLNFDAPLVLRGEAGVVGGYEYNYNPMTNMPAPLRITLGSHPDALTDARIGTDARIWGAPGGRFRLGAGAQLLVPNGTRGEYTTDDSFRAMLRALCAGDVGRLTYAAQLGVHIRPLDMRPVPDAPRGSELLFGAAAGARFSPWPGQALIVGPEIFGATAFRSFFSSGGTALEAMLTGRLEGTAPGGRQMRLKLGAGGGLNADFGAPEWRIVAAVELFNRDVTVPASE